MIFKIVSHTIAILALLSLSVVRRSQSIVHSTTRPATASTQAYQVPSAPQSEVVPGSVIVKLKPSFSMELSLFNQSDILKAVPSLQKVSGIDSVKKLFPLEPGPRGSNFPDLSRIFEVHFNPDQDPFMVSAELAEDPGIEYVEPRFVYRLAYTPDDAFYAEQKNLQLVNAASAWEVQKGDTSIVIGIVDSGTEWHHPDLETNIWKNPNEIPDNGVDDDQNGFIDDVMGWDFGDNDNDPANRNNVTIAGHGTWVAGVTSAVTDNQIGVAGIAFNCKIMAVKACSDRALDPTTIPFGIEGIKYAADNGADIINVSFGGQSFSNYGNDVITFANAMGSLVVAAAGNDNQEFPFYPAAFENVLAVTTTDYYDRKAGFANFGKWIDLAAPGVGIMTTDRNGSYSNFSGSSLAAPLVSGTAALVRSYHPDWTIKKIKEQLLKSADDIDFLNESFAGKLGSGRLNALNALTGVFPAIEIVATRLRRLLNDAIENRANPDYYQMVVYGKNVLADANNVVLTLRTDDPYLWIIKAQSHINSIASNEVADNSQDPFIFSVSAEAPVDHTVHCVIDITANQRTYHEQFPLTVAIEPLFADHDAGNVTLTVTAIGNLGFADYPINKKGNGFHFNREKRNLLNEGALLAGINSLQIANVARYKKQQDRGFKLLKGGNILFQQPGNLADQQTIASFENLVGIEGMKIIQESYGYCAHPDDDYVMLKYTIQNTSDRFDIRGLYVGLFLDWNIDSLQADFVDLDRDLSLGYMYGQTCPIFCGVKVLNGFGATSYRAIDNKAYLNDPNGFMDLEKFQYLSSGFQKTQIAIPGDYSHLIATGPFDIKPGAKAVAGFAILGSSSLAELKTNAAAARKKWLQLFGDYLPGNPPVKFSLKHNYPNPFNTMTHLRFDVPYSTQVTIKIFNLLGQEVEVVTDGIIERGSHVLQWQGKDKNGIQVAGGIYFAQMQAENFSHTIKILLLP